MKLAKLLLALAAFALLFPLAFADHYTGHTQLNVTYLNTDFFNTPNIAASTSITQNISAIGNISRAILWFSQSEELNDNVYTGQIANSTQLIFRRLKTAIGNISWFITEFDSGVKVTRGNVSIGEGAYTATVNIQNATNLSTAFLLFSYAYNGTLLDSGYIFGNFTNTTELFFSRNDTKEVHDIEWQVIEFLDNTTVLSGTNTMNGNILNVDINFTTPIDVSRSFPVISFNATGVGGVTARALLRANITNSTQMKVFRTGGQAGSLITFSWFVVTLNNTNASVQRFDANLTVGSEERVTITEVNLSRAVIHGYTTTSISSPGTANFAVNFSNSTVVNLWRRTASGSDTRGTFYVIEFPFTASPPAAVVNTSPAYSTFGRSVSLNLAFNITSRTDDTLSSSNDYAASSTGNVVLGLVSPTAFGTRYDTGYSSNEYIIEMRKPLKEGRFFLVFTRGDPSALTSKIESLRVRGMAGRTFGDFNMTAPEKMDIFLRAEYRDVNILNRVYITPGNRKIAIKNEGVDDKGVTNVSIEAII